MAHIMKMKRGSLANYFAHIDRVDDKKNQKRTYSTEVDKSKTYLNYSLNDEFLRDDFKNLSTKERLDKRLEELREGQPKVKKYKKGQTPYKAKKAIENGSYKEEDFYEETYRDFREDANILCSLVVQIPRDKDGNLIITEPSEQKKFFEGVASYGSEKWGKNNLLDISIHLDEITSHCHLVWVPSVINKEGKDQLNCKKVITLKVLQELHQEMTSYLQKYLNRDDFSLLRAEVSEYDREKKEFVSSPHSTKASVSVKEFKNQEREAELEHQKQQIEQDYQSFKNEKDKQKTEIEEELQKELKEIKNLQKQREQENQLLTFSKEQNKKEELKLKNTSKQLEETNQQLEIQQKELEKAKFDYADVLEIEKYEHPKTLFGTDKTKIIVPVADIEHQNKVSINNATVAMREKEKALKADQEASNAKYALRQHMTNYDVHTLSEKVKEQENQIKDLKKDNRNLNKYYNSVQKTLLKLEPSLRDEINKSIKKELSRDGFIIE